MAERSARLLHTGVAERVLEGARVIWELLLAAETVGVVSILLLDPAC